MKVRWEQMFPGQTLDAALSTVPSQMSRSGDVVLSINGPAPLVVYPGSARGVEIIEATPDELQALREAGFDLPSSTPPQPTSTPDAGAGKKWWQFWK
jgi:hypothetical protein